MSTPRRLGRWENSAAALRGNKKLQEKWPAPLPVFSRKRSESVAKTRVEPSTVPNTALMDRLAKKRGTLNDTGIVPVEYKCVVRVVVVEKKTPGGIIIPPDRWDRDQMATTTATLLEAGGNAFEDWKGRKPEPGDNVLIQKYAGQFKEADPTDPIRVVHDKEILAILEPVA